MEHRGWVAGADLWAWRQGALHEAQAAGIDTQEVDWLLESLTDADRLSLKLGMVQHRPQVSLGVSLGELNRLWKRRLHQRVPVQYLVGKTPWRNLTLAVSPAVLIPRPETELMIDLAKAAIARSPMRDQLAQGLWVDMGTGSGAIAIALAQTFPAARLLAVDLSVAALAVAQDNAARAGLSDRITFYQGSWFDPLVDYRGQVSALLSNPPYIPSALLSTLQPEVVNHEPAAALDGGEDGLDGLRRLATQAADYLVPGGLWLAEMMAGQGEAVQAMLIAQGGYRDIEICLDLAGRDRFVQATYAP